MTDYPLDAKAIAAALAERRDRGSGTPPAYRDAHEAWQAGYRMGLGDARVVVAELATASNQERAS